MCKCQMLAVGRCKSAKHDSLFMICSVSHETNIYSVYRFFIDYAKYYSYIVD